MTRHIFGRATLVAFACTLCLSMRGDPPKPDLQKENSELRKRIAELEAKVQSLECRLRLEDGAALPLEWKLNPVPPLTKRDASPTPRKDPFVAPPSGPALPPGTVERRMNGEPYYVIPLEARR